MSHKEKKEEIWQSYDKSPELKQKKVTTQKATKNFDYPTIAMMYCP